MIIRELSTWCFTNCDVDKRDSKTTKSIWGSVWLWMSRWTWARQRSRHVSRVKKHSSSRLNTRGGVVSSEFALWVATSRSRAREGCEVDVVVFCSIAVRAQVRRGVCPGEHSRLQRVRTRQTGRRRALLGGCRNTHGSRGGGRWGARTSSPEARPWKRRRIHCTRMRAVSPSPRYRTQDPTHLIYNTHCR